MKELIEGVRDMLIVELGADDFDDGFVRIGRLAKAIAKARNPNLPAADLLNIERKTFPEINAAVQLGKLKPVHYVTSNDLDKSDYGTGIVPFSELVEWGQATKQFDFRVGQFTVNGINSITTMNSTTYKEYEDAREARQSKGRYSLEEAAQYVDTHSTANAKSIFEKLEKSAKTFELAIYWPDSDEVYKPKTNKMRGCEEAYWNDLNTWLEKNEPRLDCEFTKPGAPSAKSSPDNPHTPMANWKMRIQAQAAIIWNGYRDIGCSPTKHSIKGDLVKWCREEGVITGTGITPNEDYIYRHVLNGWTPPEGKNN